MEIINRPWLEKESSLGKERISSASISKLGNEWQGYDWITVKDLQELDYDISYIVEIVR